MNLRAGRSVIGKREHWMPGNRRKRIPVREKRAFESREAAKQHLRDHQQRQFMRIYQCGVCGKWHLATGYRP